MARTASTGVQTGPLAGLPGPVRHGAVGHRQAAAEVPRHQVWPRKVLTGLSEKNHGVSYPKTRMHEKHLNIATCKWWFPNLFGVAKATCFKWLQNRDLLRSPATLGWKKRTPAKNHVVLPGSWKTKGNPKKQKTENGKSFWVAQLDRVRRRLRVKASQRSCPPNVTRSKVRRRLQLKVFFWSRKVPLDYQQVPAKQVSRRTANRWLHGCLLKPTKWNREMVRPIQNGDLHRIWIPFHAPFWCAILKHDLIQGVPFAFQVCPTKTAKACLT